MRPDPLGHARCRGGDRGCGRRLAQQQPSWLKPVIDRVRRARRSIYMCARVCALTRAVFSPTQPEPCDDFLCEICVCLVFIASPPCEFCEHEVSLTQLIRFGTAAPFQAGPRGGHREAGVADMPSKPRVAPQTRALEGISLGNSGQGGRPAGVAFGHVTHSRSRPRMPRGIGQRQRRRGDGVGRLQGRLHRLRAEARQS